MVKLFHYSVKMREKTDNTKTMISIKGPSKHIAQH